MGLFRSPITKGPDGGATVRIGMHERAVLADLAQQLRALVSDVDPSVPPDELRARLFPRAYEDPLDQHEYAEVATGQLAEHKTTMLDTFLATLDEGRVKGSTWTCDLDPDQTVAWLNVLNDGRLVLGKIVGIETEEDWETVRSSGDQAAILLDYLSMLQESLIGVMMGTLEH